MSEDYGKVNDVVNCWGMGNRVCIWSAFGVLLSLKQTRCVFDDDLGMILLISP